MLASFPDPHVLSHERGSGITSGFLVVLSQHAYDCNVTVM